MFNSRLIAGFECAHLGWNGHDLLVSTGHVPGQHMEEHFAVAQSHGMLTARDGLPWRHPIAPRLQAAKDAGMQVIWDLDHYWQHAEPELYAERVAKAALAVNGDAPLWVCAVNEPEIVPMMCTGLSRADAIVTGLRILAALKARHPDVRVLSVDAVTHADGPWEGTQAFAYQADVIGINVYPHTLRGGIAPILIAAHRRFGKPVMISETSWHDGFHQWPGITDKAGWLRFVEAQIAEAQAAGVDVVGLCWYPIVCCPPWDAPDAPERWAHGLINAPGTTDPVLSAALQGSINPAS